METPQSNVLSQPFPTEKDISQPFMLNPDVLDNAPRIDEPEKTIKNLGKYINSLILDTRINGTITGAITTLMFLEKSDEQIVELGRKYIVKYITSSIPVIQTILRDIKERNSLPNDEDSLRGIKLVKEICESLIDDFGIHSNP